MRRLLLLRSFCWWIILVVPFTLTAQNNYVDSLYAIWSDTTNSAEERVEAYYQRFFPLQNEMGNEEVARWTIAVDKAIALAQAVGKMTYLGRLKMVKSGHYIAILQDFEIGCGLAEEAYLTSLKAEDFASAYYSLIFVLAGNCNSQAFTNQYGHPIRLMSDLSSKITEQSPSEEQLALFSLGGSMAFSTQHYPEALVLLQRVVDFYQANNSINLNYALTLESLARLHYRIENYELAAKYLRQRGYLEHQLADTVALGGYYIDLAENQLARQLLPEAMRALDSARIVMSGQAECEACQMRLQRILAGIENRNGNYEEALAQLLQILPFYQDEGRPYSGTNRLNIGLFYNELGTSYLGLLRYEEAIVAAQEGLKRFDYYLLTGDQHKILYQGKLALGRYEEAIQHYQSYIQIRDSLTQVRNSQLVTRLELQSQYERQRLADSLQQQIVYQEEISRQKNSRNILLVFGLFAALIAIGLYYRYRFVQKTKMELEEKNRIIEAEKEKAQSSERAKHQFLANMSHEIRTPMNAIKGMTDILLRRNPKPEQNEFLDGIKQSSDSLLVIINDILDISKIEAGKIEFEQVPFSLPEAIQGVQTIMQFKAEEKSLELQSSLPDKLPGVLGDPTRLRQILINLVGNGIKFTEKGMVGIKVQVLDQTEEQLHVQFTVSDTGVGISKDRLEQIFESFEQAYSDTTRKFGGTGLGLSISKKMVELQNGKIWVDSEKGKGSQFHFTIIYPIATEQVITEESVISDKIDYSKLLAGIHILLVEDNTFNAIVAQEELEDAISKVQVDVAENGAIAVEKVQHNTYDVILMDVQMPVMNGYEATQKIRALSNEKSNTPIIAMTANVMKEEVERSYEMGMDDFIGKPFDTGELLEKIYFLTKANV